MLDRSVINFVISFVHFRRINDGNDIRMQTLRAGKFDFLKTLGPRATRDASLGK